MTTFIPVEGEIVLTNVPKTPDALAVLLASSTTDAVSPVWIHASTGEAFIVNGRETRENARATRFAQGRNLESSYLPLRGPVLLFSEEEKLTFDLYMTAERNTVARQTQIVSNIANAVQSGAITMLGVSSGSGKTAAAIPPGALPPVLVTGNTFPVKDQLKALGGKWDPVAKGWTVPADKAAEAQVLISGAPKPTSRRYGARASSSTQAASNGNVRPNAKPGKCDVCGCRVDIGKGALHYIVEDSGDLRFHDHGGWVVTCHPNDGDACKQRRETLLSDKRKASQEAADRLKAERVAAKSENEAYLEAVANATGAVANLIKTSASLFTDQTRLSEKWVTVASMKDRRFMTGRAASGETIYCEWISGFDEDRTYYYLPKDLAEQGWTEIAVKSNITSAKAAEWLLKYRGCEGTEWYEFIARQGV